MLSRERDALVEPLRQLCVQKTVTSNRLRAILNEFEEELYFVILDKVSALTPTQPPSTTF